MMMIGRDLMYVIVMIMLIGIEQKRLLKQKKIKQIFHGNLSQKISQFGLHIILHIHSKKLNKNTNITRLLVDQKIVILFI